MNMFKCITLLVAYHMIHRYNPELRHNAAWECKDYIHQFPLLLYSTN